MICPECAEDRDFKDFLGKEVCYKCIYNAKIKGIIKISAIPVCVICKAVLSEGKRKFCSEECIKENNNIHNRTYWTRNIKAEVVKWK